MADDARRAKLKRNRYRRLVREEMGERLRELYGVERRWAVSRRRGFCHYCDASVFHESSEFNLWMRLAKRVLELLLDPGLFMQRAFAYSLQAWPARGYPLPDDLMRPAIFDAYLEGQRNDAAAVRFTLRSDSAAFQINMRIETQTAEPDWTAEEVLGYVLCHSGLGISSLYRYCVAVEAGLTRVAEQYFCRAAVQYMSRRMAYAEQWRALLPEDFDGRARIRYRQLRK